MFFNLKNSIKSLFFFKSLSKKNKKNTYHKRWEKARKQAKKRLKDVVVYKLVFKVTRNNVFINVSDPMGRYVFYSSGGLNYFFLRKRSVAVANILLGENIGAELRSKSIYALDLEFFGLPFYSHRYNFVKGLVSSGLIVRNVSDKTPIAHNGCYRSKKRRKKLKRR